MFDWHLKFFRNKKKKKPKIKKNLKRQHSLSIICTQKITKGNQNQPTPIKPNHYILYYITLYIK